MAKLDEVTNELPLNDERIEPKTHNRHVTVALNHLHKRRDSLNAAKAKIDLELNEIVEAIQALG